MVLINENEEKISKELLIQEEINNCIKLNESFYFNAGAGAGKTYALISSLKYVLHTEGILKTLNQKALCITYTNTAKDEMKERLGINDQVTISTIHDFIWGLIKVQQPLLVECHKQKIIVNIENIKKNLNSKEVSLFYYEMNTEEKKEFLVIIQQKEFKHVYRKNYSLNAGKFKEKISSYVENKLSSIDILKSVSKFKKVVDMLNKLQRLEEAKLNIECKNIGYTEVRYNSSNNKDVLHKMEFSHDTLLEYGRQIIVNYDYYNILKKMIIDKYSVILIDEYQDTSHEIITIMERLNKYAEEHNFSLTVGYFGDTVQSIFNEGVGSELTGIHHNLKLIEKTFNRRSTSEVIQVINKIRCDAIIQESIFSDSTGGSVELIQINSEQNAKGAGEIQKEAEKYYLEFKEKIISKNPKKRFACLVLKHKTLSEILGFSSLYSSVTSMPRFKNSNYNQINTEFLGNNSKNLGYFILSLKNMFELKKLINQPETPVKNIMKFFRANFSKTSLTFKEFHDLILLIKKNTATTLRELLVDIIQIANNKDGTGKYLRTFLKKEYSLEVEGEIIFEDIQNIAYKYFKFSEETDFSLLEYFFGISIEEFENWYSYVTETTSEGINYITYHSAKGLEFDHVMVVYDNKFANDKKYFERFLMDIEGTKILEEKDRRKWQNARNLFYVACSRARINLRLIITDSDYSIVKKGLNQVGFE